MINYPEYAKIGNKKYKINTDFRIAIECQSVATDNSINDYERALAIIYMLFGEKGLKDFENHEKLLEIATKFLSCGKKMKEDTIDEEHDMDYKQDMEYIEASFMSDYGIDLSNREMHWWKFFKLINGLSNSELGNCCILNRIRNLRNYDTNQIKDPKEKEKMEKAKKEIALNKGKLNKIYTKEEQENMESFYKSIGL